MRDRDADVMDGNMAAPKRAEAPRLSVRGLQAHDLEFFLRGSTLSSYPRTAEFTTLFLGGAAFIFSLLFKLSDVISAILAMRILVQFIGQAIGVILLRKRNGTAHLPYTMFLYPLPVILAILIWIFIFVSTGWKFVLSGLTVMSIGVIVYLLMPPFKPESRYLNEVLLVIKLI